MTLSTVTALCVDTIHHGSALAACRVMAQLGFAEVVLVTDDAIDRHPDAASLPPGVRIECIAPLTGIGAYSRFLLDTMIEHVRTPHVLVFQWDGFVLDATRWWPGYLEYDYIGAPWPSSFGRTGRVVGNGGFSLRSMKLLRALREIRPDSGDRPEDHVICIDLAERLENEFGIRFAPVEVAKYFSIEHYSLPNFSDSPHWSRVGTFGFHGFFNFHLALSDSALLDLVDTKMTDTERTALLSSWSATTLLVNLSNEGRRASIQALTQRMAQACGMPDPDTVEPQQVIDEILARR
ncbi:hypothetical protein BLA39750_03401 [Burkholderia lata]|uniref:DUF5672 domain-containing protein n=1 Tax=Burkholderia lata (strain ATCC 17760 / DSM 23089 / LMG 22485 / NCIMB 9086 / R18194 / 383) TaxID=482957 RepID=A0A6P2Y046_BURL3|nr:DUF5672 family protein [Burkholderia lata]VWD13626.1 hypothetical protein BLA39750_03401 [Burkholderia lata]